MERTIPRLLDLCCGAGGATKGYMDAGFYVMGVDIQPQPHYSGNAFYQADALTFPLDGFDVVHVSPPCQGYSPLTACQPGAQKKHPLLIGAFRERFQAAGVCYVIENVAGAKRHMQSPVLLCGAMFGLRTYRHRLFESTVPFPVPLHPAHRMPVAAPGAIARPGQYWSVAGHFGQKDRAQREALGIDWMHTQAEIANAIPPAYTAWIGHHLMQWREQSRQTESLQQYAGEACAHAPSVRPSQAIRRCCVPSQAGCRRALLQSYRDRSPLMRPKSHHQIRSCCPGHSGQRVQHEQAPEDAGVQTEAIRLYCGMGATTYHHHPIACGPSACISPVYGRDDGEHVTACSRRNRVYVPDGVAVMQDSGAFSDGPRHRLSYADALARQIAHAKLYKYASQVTHRASYDLLIDETWMEALRHKQRWSEEAGRFAVSATVEAAAYLNAHRSPGIGCIMSVQGVTTAQYLACTEQVLPYVDVESDMFGLGGWCILGKRPSLLATFRETMQQVIPRLAAYGVKRVHIWGVCFPPALGALLWLCDHHHLHLSTDSSGPFLHPTMGQWGYGSWRDPSYRKPPILASCKAVDASGYKAPTCAPETRCLGLEQARHVAHTRAWLAHFREREPQQYRSLVRPPYRQLSWVEDSS